MLRASYCIRSCRNRMVLLNEVSVRRSVRVATTSQSLSIYRWFRLSQMTPPAETLSIHFVFAYFSSAALLCRPVLPGSAVLVHLTGTLVSSLSDSKPCISSSIVSCTSVGGVARSYSDYMSTFNLPVIITAIYWCVSRWLCGEDKPRMW